MTMNNLRPIVRAAQADDLDAIVDVEFTAFDDAYEKPRDPQTITDVRQKFANRIELLGEWARILVAPGGEIVGMSLAYPINIVLAELIDLIDQGYDMADSDVISELFDKNGTALWGLNLAVVRSAPLISGTAFLSASMRSLKAAHGIKSTFFTSRLSGLASWASAQLPGVDVAALPRAQQETLAEQYMRATVQRGGVSRTVDPLLAMRIDAGAVPVGLVSRWRSGKPERGYIDMPSLGFGALCTKSRRLRATRLN
jgi:hypothetical protein